MNTNCDNIPFALNDDELQLLTGYKNRSSQLDWLNRNGWIYIVNARGVPIVGRYYCNLKMAGGSVKSEYPEPDFSKINQPLGRTAIRRKTTNQ